MFWLFRPSLIGSGHHIPAFPDVVCPSFGTGALYCRPVYAACAADLAAILGPCRHGVTLCHKTRPESISWFLQKNFPLRLLQWGKQISKPLEPFQASTLTLGKDPCRLEKTLVARTALSSRKVLDLVGLRCLPDQRKGDGPRGTCVRVLYLEVGPPSATLAFTLLRWCSASAPFLLACLTCQARRGLHLRFALLVYKFLLGLLNQLLEFGELVIR